MACKRIVNSLSANPSQSSSLFGLRNRLSKQTGIKRVLAGLRLCAYRWSIHHRDRSRSQPCLPECFAQLSGQITDTSEKDVWKAKAVSRIASLFTRRYAATTLLLSSWYTPTIKLF